MKVRKMRLFRIKHRISLSELARFCGVSSQYISEIELNPEPKLGKETSARLLAAFSSVVEERNHGLMCLQQDFLNCKDTLLDAVEETTYEL